MDRDSLVTNIELIEQLLAEPAGGIVFSVGVLPALRQILCQVLPVAEVVCFSLPTKPSENGA